MNNDDEHNKHAEGLVRQVWNNHLRYYDEGDVFGFDTSLPDAIALSLRPFPEDMAVALDWWRNKMVAGIDEQVQRYKDNNPNSVEFK